MSKSNDHITRFHWCHGNNISLLEDKTVAYRKRSFANALAFSEKPLAPGEVFLIEIEQIENGWNGHMRMGLTQLDPYHIFHCGRPPQYALPDLTARGSSWVFGISKAWNNFHSSAFLDTLERGNNASSDCVWNLLKTEKDKRKLPTDIKSRIGIVYLPVNADHAHMHYIINGEDKGPCVKTIPYKDGPLFVVVDVYGSTKKVRIIQIYGVPSLQSLCRDIIRKTITTQSVQKLPLPNVLKDYLLLS